MYLQTTKWHPLSPKKLLKNQSPLQKKTDKYQQLNQPLKLIKNHMSYQKREKLIKTLSKISFEKILDFFSPTQILKNIEMKKLFLIRYYLKIIKVRHCKK